MEVFGEVKATMALSSRNHLVLMEHGSYCRWPSWNEETGPDDENPPDELPEDHGEDQADFLQRPHDLAPGIPFLSVCRHIYHEAIGILYGSNTFLATAPYHRHNNDLIQVKAAADFIVSVGLQASTVNSSVIDIGPRCGAQYGDEEDYNLLPRVRVL